MQHLAWGLSDSVPAEATAAWGARAILREGAVDLVPNRQDHWAQTESGKVAFFNWVDTKAIPWLNKEARNIRGNELQLYAFDEGDCHIRANANASHGYLYVAAWTTAAETVSQEG